MNAKRILLCTVALVMSICAANVKAAEYDLTTLGSTAEINDAWFYQYDPDSSTGTGLIQSFVRIQATGSESGYNTDWRPVQFDELTSATFTHSLLLSDVPIVNIDGVDYREFLLDINENSGGSHELLSLDILKLYTADTGDLHDYASWGTPLYDMDELADNWITLDYNLNAGSGGGDMLAYIPNDLFAGAEDYVYLFSEFGVHSSSDAGFEEWAVRMGGPVVPVPAGLVLGMLGLTVAGVKLRKFA